MRDLLTSKVIQSDIGNRVMAVLKADGTGADLTRILNTIFPGGQPPSPGTIVALNEATDLTPFQYTSGREVRADFTYDELVDNICAGVGIARPYLGLAPAQGSGTTQAGALTNVEPSVKAFDERQQLLDETAHDMFERVMTANGITGEVEREFIFPDIVEQDRSQLLEDLEVSVANGWLSGRTAAEIAAAAQDLTDYDYDDEVNLIIKEFELADDTDGKNDDGSDKPARGGKMRRPLIRATARQVPRIDPTKAQSQDDEPLGMLVGANGAAGAPGAPGAPAPRGAAGMPAARNPASKSNGTRAREARRNRRHPDDPEFEQHTSEFDEQTAKNLERLLTEIA
jgi:hypothetical protein